MMGRARRARRDTERQSGLTLPAAETRPVPALVDLPPGVALGDVEGGRFRGPWADLGESLEDAGAWLRRATADEAQGAHHTAALVRQMVDSWLPVLVDAAREQGASWTAIGTAEGITKQSAHVRYGGTS